MVILVIGIAFVIEKAFFPSLNELLANFTAFLRQFLVLLQDWRFYIVIMPVIGLLFLSLYAFAQKKALQREREERAHSLFWKKEDEENERRKLLLSHTQVKLEKQEVFPEIEEFSDEQEEPEEQEKPRVRPSINVDFRKIFYKRKELNKHEIKYLIKHGYQEYSHKSIVTNKKENYLLKPRHNESLRHMIFVFDIFEFLQGRNIEAAMYTTRMPDVVFKVNGKEFAIEVETGTVIKNMKKFREKLVLLNEKYGKKWYFVVTNRNLIKKYRKFGKVIDPRFIKFNLLKIIKNA